MWYLLAITRDYSFLGNYKLQCKEEDSEKEMRVGMHKNVCINFALTKGQVTACKVYLNARKQIFFGKIPAVSHIQF